MSRFERWSRRKRGMEIEDGHEEHAQLSPHAPIDSEQGQTSLTVDLTSTPEEGPTSVSLQAQEAVQPELQLDSSAEDIDAQLPDPDTLAPGSDLSAFLQAGVSPALKRRALRRMFAAESYNVRDGLDDYDHDFTKMRKLGSETTAQLRRWMHKLTEDTEETADNESATDKNVSEAPVAESVQEATHPDDEVSLADEHKNADPDKETADNPADPARPMDRSV